MILTILLLVLGFFISTSPVFAVSVTISNTPSSITDEPFNIDVSVSGAQAATNYLRANLFPTGTTKYFGYTNNGTDFVNSSDYSQYFPITIDSSGSWSGSIQAKLDPESKYYTGPGAYSLKVRRYTQSGSSYTWSNEVSLNISFATPTPTPTPTSTPTPNPTSTPKPSPTPTPTLAPTPRKTTTQTISTPTPTPKVNSVAGVSATATPSASPNIEVKGERRINFLSILGTIIVIIGAGAFGYAIYNKFRGRNKGVS